MFGWLSPAVEQPVVAEVDARHAAAPELAPQLVASPDQLSGLEAHRASMAARMIAAAVGAAASPPVRLVSSTMTATATTGSWEGAKPMNQAWFLVGSADSAVPVL